MTPRERAIRALTLKPPAPGVVPAAELEFQLTWEKFRRRYHTREEYDAAQGAELARLVREDAELRVAVHRAYDLAFTILHAPPGRTPRETVERMRRLIGAMRELSGDEFLMVAHGDATLALPDGKRMWELSVRMVDDRENLLRELGERVERQLALGEQLVAAGVEAFALCADYCYNTGPWCSPAMFAEFVTPFLKRLVEGYRSMGAYVIKHTDGNIMPILDQLLECRPHALHSLDPQAGVDIAEVKRLCGDRVCLIGNVNCALMQTGTEDEIVESARYALRHGMPGGGYIFSTSNVAFAGLPLERYELIHRVRRKEGVYPAPTEA